MALGQQNFRDGIFSDVIFNGDVLEIHDGILNILYGVMWCQRIWLHQFQNFSSERGKSKLVVFMENA